jgi:hypothetical protein
MKYLLETELYKLQHGAHILISKISYDKVIQTIVCVPWVKLNASCILG